MKTIQPFRGEFGLKVRYHVPAAYALGPGHRIIIEEGEEALYPLAAEWVSIDRREDDERRGWTDPAAGTYGAEQPINVGRGDRMEWFMPRPHLRQDLGEVDVVICPRQRNYGSTKNWPHWDWLARQLVGDGFRVFAAGAPDSSMEVECPRAWDYVRFLDASIEAVLKARLVIATDAGLAHLAVLCGTPLLLITFGGLVAPGPVVDSAGVAMEPGYWAVRLEEYYHSANHMGSPIHVSNAWQFRKLLEEEIHAILG